VQKSGYFARSSAPNKNDISLIDKICKKAVDYALEGKSGVAGLNDNKNKKIDCIDFRQIKGGKPFNSNKKWYRDMLVEIGQEKG